MSPSPATVANLVLPSLRADADGRFDHERARLEAALALGVGGFILFGGTRETVRELVAELQARAGRRLLIASDLERGTGQQVAGATELPPPAALAALGDAAAVRWCGMVTAREARALGINWVFAPVADLDLAPDNPIVQTRAFGRQPEEVAAYVREWIAGCERAGALACAKHYPGHGRTLLDSHVTLPVVSATAEQLGAEDLVPFRAAADAGVGSMMTAHVAYPALDPSGAPATLSAPMLGLLRRELGYDGLVVSDALTMAGLTAGRSERLAAVEALAAGVDVLLYPDDLAGVVAELQLAAVDGRLTPARVREAGRRYARALARVATTAEAPPATAAAEADLLADRILAAPGAPRVTLQAPLSVEVVDDDVGGAYPPSATDGVVRALEAAGIPLGQGGSRLVLAFAEPRAWKGRAGFGPASRAALAAARGADLLVLFAHPRLAGELPAGVPTLVAWHRQALMQRAVARWVARALG